MPRMENTDRNGSTEIRDFCNATGEGSSTFDLCKRCAAKYLYMPLSAARLIPYNGDPAGILGNDGVDHPEYRGEDYECAVCMAPLGWKDE